MGDEARATVQAGDRVSEGKALLETDELHFRGDFRLAIPLRAVRSVSAEDGRLTVEYSDGTVTFDELGARAERWAERIRNPKTLLDKLGLERGMRVSVVDVRDESFRALVRERGIDAAEEPVADADYVVFEVESVADLDRIGALRRSLKPNGAIWVVAPKGGREPREAQVLDAGKRAGLVDVKVARFSNTHTAHKFVIPKSER